VSGIKDKKFRVISWQGIVLMDLLEHAQQLVARGNTSTQTQAHTAYLQTLTHQESSQPKAEIKPQVASNNSQIQPKDYNLNIYLLVGGLILLLGSVF
jgi:hypothetical protein